MYYILIPEEAFATQCQESTRKGVSPNSLMLQSFGTYNDELGRTIGPAQYIPTVRSRYNNKVMKITRQLSGY